MNRDAIQRVCIYLRQSDLWQNTPLFEEVLLRLQREGASGATVLSGIRSFGPGYRVRTTLGPLEQGVPLLIEWIDRADRVARILPTLDALLSQALITIEPVQIYRAALRSRGAFGDERGLGELVPAQPLLASPTDQARAAMLALLDHGQSALPVVDQQQRVIGLVGWPQLQQRAGLSLGLRMLQALPADERLRQLQPLVSQNLAALMDPEPRSLPASLSPAQAVGSMLEWGYTALPVIDREGRCVGLFDLDTALKIARAAAPTENQAIRDAAVTTVQMVLQSVPPRVSLETPALLALRQLLESPERLLVVLDADNALAGLLYDSAVFQRLEQPARSAWLAALAQPVAPASLNLPGLDQPLSALLDPVPPLYASATLFDALARLLDHGYERLPVIDSERHVLGMLGRGGLLRALAQEG